MLRRLCSLKICPKVNIGRSEGPRELAGCMADIKADETEHGRTLNLSWWRT